VQHEQAADHPQPPHIFALPPDLDLVTSDETWQQLEPLLTTGALVVLDCAPLIFADSTGLRVLLLAQRTAREYDATLRLARVPALLHHLLDLSGTRHLFTIDEPATETPEPADPTREPPESTDPEALTAP
jgi:anti-sigma B factor antagonist